MKVLQVSNNFPTRTNPIFGIFVKDQIESLNNLGIINEIFFINGREKGKREYLKAIFKLHKLLYKEHYDIVHCHHTFSAICFILTGQTNKFKSVVSYQNDPVNEHGKVLFRFIKKRVNGIILKNNSKLVDNISVFNQPNGVNTNLFYPKDKMECYSILKLDPNIKYILFVSSNYIRKQKRYDKFQEVLSILRKKHRVENIEELRLINTERNLVPYYFNAASLHLLCSDFEGSPNSVKEAMACNIPVVSTNVGNVKELLSGVSGCYVAQGNSPEELAELSFKVLTNINPINARENLIKKELDLESVAKKIVSIYERVANE